jgi:hypothetical protein
LAEKSRGKGKVYKSGALLIAFAGIWVGILIEITRRTDLGAVDIVGIDVLTLLVGLKAWFLLYGCHDARCLGVDWSTRV